MTNNIYDAVWRIRQKLNKFYESSIYDEDNLSISFVINLDTLDEFITELHKCEVILDEISEPSPDVYYVRVYFLNNLYSIII